MKPLHPLAQSLLREFEDVFSDGLPSGLPLFRGIKHQIDLLPSVPLPDKPAYSVTPIIQMNYNDKSKSFLIIGTLGKT